MSAASRKLNVGDWAVTDYNGSRTRTMVQIVAVARPRCSQSGTLFQVTPQLLNGSADSWYDADWFEPVPSPTIAQPEGER